MICLILYKIIVIFIFHEPCYRFSSQVGQEVKTGGKQEPVFVEAAEHLRAQTNPPKTPPLKTIEEGS